MVELRVWVKVKVKSLSRVRLFATPWTPGSSVHGIFQARVLEWGAIAFSDFSAELLTNYRKDNVILCKLVLPDDMTPVRTMGILCHHRSDSLLTEPQGSLVYTVVYSERK